MSAAARPVWPAVWAAARPARAPVLSGPERPGLAVTAEGPGGGAPGWGQCPGRPGPRGRSSAPRAAEDTVVLGQGAGSRHICPSEGSRLVRRGGPRGLGQSRPAGPGHQRAPLRQAGRDREGRPADGPPGSKVRPQRSLRGGRWAPGPGWVTCRAGGEARPLECGLLWKSPAQRPSSSQS